MLWWLGGGLVAAAVLVVIGLAIWPRQTTDPHAQYEKIYHEMAALFPHQVRSIVCDDQGVHVDLADQPVLPSSPPVLLTVCANSQPCREIITFSGQQVRVDGQSCEVLTDGSGNILLIGDRFVWSSDKKRALDGTGTPDKIEAQRL